MIRRFFRHIREGFYGVGRHLSMAFSSATAMTITLILVSVFAVLMINMNEITRDIEQQVQISVLIDYDHEDAQSEQQIGDAIRAIDGVRTVTFSSKDDEAQYYLENYSQADQAIVDLIMSDNPLHDAYYVTLNDGQSLESVANAIVNIEGVADVNYGGTSALQLINMLDVVRNGGLIIVAALTILTMFLIQNTIKLTIFARQKEISIMRNVGAKNGYIRAPFLVEGIIIGILGSIIPIIVTIFGYIYLYNYTGGVLLSSIFVLIPPHPFILYIGLFLLGFAIVIGFVGSFLSVTKYLRWTR